MLEDTLQAIQACRNALKHHPMHHLILPERKKLWLSFGPIEYEEDGRTAKKTEAYFKRWQLTLNTCKKVLPIWEKYISDVDIPRQGLHIAEQYLSGEMDADKADSELHSLFTGLAYTEGMSKEQLNATLVGHACLNGAYTTIYDVDCDDMDDLDEDYDAWDISMSAAGAYSGGYPWLTNEYASDPQKLYEFWNWYLDEAENLAHKE